MFPQSGSGTTAIAEISALQSNYPLPHSLYPYGEANAKYQLSSVLSEHGRCFCEVSFADKQIDLVWLEHGESNTIKRIVGIEIKTASAFEKAKHKIESQVEHYRESTLSDVRDVDYVSQTATIRSDNIFLFDEIWMIVTLSRERWTLPWRDDCPEDGWLKYNMSTGEIEYEIDTVDRREVIPLDYEQRASEAQITATLWNRYQSPKTLVAAETPFSKPQNRQIKHGELEFRAGKGQAGKTKHADLVIGKKSEISPLTPNSVIRAIEVKTSLNSSIRTRLDEQLSLYCDSKMFSEVYLAVPNTIVDRAVQYLDDKHPQVGLLGVSTDQIESMRDADQLELEKVPIINGDGSYKFGP